MFSAIIAAFASGVNSFRKFLGKQREAIEKKEKKNIETREAKRMELEDIQKQCNKAITGSDKLTDAEKRIIERASQSKKKLANPSGLGAGKRSFYKMKAAAKAAIQSKKATRVLALRGQELALFTLYILLEVLKYIVMLIEQIVIMLVSTLGVIGIIIIVAFLVVFLVIMALDVDNKDIDDWNSVGSSDCIEGGQSLIDSGFNSQFLGQMSGTLTEQQKNLYKSLKIYTDIFNNKYGDYSELFTDNYKNLLKNSDMSLKIAATMGFMAIENGFKFGNSSDIYTIPIVQSADENNDAWFGLEAEKKDFDGKYEGKQYYTSDFVSKFKNDYNYDYKDGMTSIYNYAPYGIAIQIGFLSGKYNEWSATHTYIDTQVPIIAAKFGIKENMDKLTNLIHFFMLANGYHGHIESMNEPEITFWCALWAATSDIDANRGFDKIELLSDNYDESTYREAFLGKGSYVGTGGTISNLSYYPNSNINKLLKINGTVLSKPLIQYISEYCASKGLTDVYACVLSDLNGRFQTGSLGRDVLNQNYHYGLFAYLSATKVIKDLGISMPTASGGNSEDCDCVEEKGSSLGKVGNIDLSNIKVGIPQGPWSSETLTFIDGYSENIKKFMGQADSIVKSDRKLTNLNKTVEEWRQSTRWGVPYYFQENTALESSQNNLNALIPELKSMGRAGCHIYMYSYMASALTGTVINPVEMYMGLNKFNGLSSGGSNQSYGAVKAFNDLGLKAISRHSSSLNGYTDEIGNYLGLNSTLLVSNKSDDLQKIVNSVLDKNGLYGFAGGPPYFTANTNHYVVIHEKVGEKYRVVGYNSYGTYSGYKEDLYNWDYIYKAMYGHVGDGVNYNGQFFIAYNPNLDINKNSASGSFVKDDNSKPELTNFHKTYHTLLPGETAIIPTGVEDVNYVNTWHRSQESWNQTFSDFQKDFLDAVGGPQYDADGLGIVNGRYVIAVVSHIGVTGDYLDVYQSDGTIIPCIVGDSKSFDDWTYKFAQVGSKTIDGTDIPLSFGHLSGMTRYDKDKGTPPSTVGAKEEEPYGNKNCEYTNIIEHLTNSLSNDAFSVAVKKHGWDKNITKIVNLGSYFHDSTFGVTQGQTGNPDCVSNKGNIISGSFTEQPGKFQGPWGDLTKYVDQISSDYIKSVSKNLIPYVGLKPKNENESNYTYNVDKWENYNGSGFVRYSQDATRNLGEDWGNVSFGDSTFYSAACGGYSTSGVLSTLLGKYITPAEIVIAMNTYSVRYPGKSLALSHIDGGSGAMTFTSLAAIIEECGFKTETTSVFDSNKVDNCLNNGGMVIYVVENTFENRYTSGAHYIVIREKTKTGYLVYSSTNWSDSTTDDYCNTENTILELEKLTNWSTDNNGVPYENAQMILVSPT